MLNLSPNVPHQKSKSVLTPLVRMVLLFLLIPALFFASCALPGVREEQEEVPPKEEKEAKPVKSAEELRQEALEKIENFMLNGDVDSALDTYQEYNLGEKGRLEDRILLGNLYFSVSRIEEAKNIYQSVLDKDSDNTKALYGLVLIAEIEGDKEDRKELLQTLSEIDPESPDVHTGLGALYLEEKNYKKALEAYEKSLDYDEDSPFALKGLAQSYLALDKLEKAEQTLTKLINIEQGDPFAFADRARIRIKNDEFRLAEEDYSRAIKLYPDYYWFYIDRGRLRANTGKAESAIDDYSQALSLDPDNYIAYLYRAKVYDSEGSVADAISDYRKCLELRPDYYPVYLPLGLLHYMNEDWEQAGAMIKKAYAREKDRYELPLLICLCLKYQEKEDQAKRYIETEVNKMPRDSLYYQMGRFFILPANDGMIFRKVEDEEDNFLKTQMQFYLASQYELNGKTSLAFSLFSEVIEAELRGLIEYRLAKWRVKKYE